MLTTYSKFGAADNVSDSLKGPQGPPGVGFTLTIDGNYDILGKDFVDVGDVNADSFSDTGSGFITSANIKMDSLYVNNIFDNGQGYIALPAIHVDTLDFQTVPNNDDTEDRLLVLDTATNTVEYRTVASLPFSFDQDLNTTDNVNFNSVTSPLISSSEFFATGDIIVNNHNIASIDGISVNSIGTTSGGDLIIVKSVDIQGHDLKNVGVLDFQTVPNNDNTENRLLVLDTATNNVEYRTVASLPIVNPFDQNLNTTDSPAFNSPSFNSLVMMGNINLQAHDILNVNTMNASIIDSVPSSGTISSFANIDLLNHDLTSIKTMRFQTVPTNDDAETRLLVLNTGDNEVRYRTATSILNNPFDQNLNTTNSPTFNALTLTTVANDNTETKLLVLDTATNIIQYRDSTSILNNPFNQSLNTSNSPSFSALTLTGDIAMGTHNINNGGIIKSTNLAGITSGNIATLATDSSSLVIDSSCLFAIQKQMSLTQITTPATPGGFTGLLYNKTGGSLCWKNTNGFEYVINDYFGKYQAYAESLTLTTSSDTVNWVTKVSIPSTAFVAGDYIVSYSSLMSNSVINFVTDVRLLEDGVQVGVSPASTRVNVGNFGPNSQFYKRTLTTANHTYDLQMRPQANTGGIEDAKVWIYRIG